LTSIAAFPSDPNGNETNRRIANIIHFDYDKSHSSYRKGDRPVRLIHLHNLDFKLRAEHARTDIPEGQHTDASSLAKADTGVQNPIQRHVQLAKRQRL
jgi:hypothetical protein